ncbi:hypothetical protein CerSpe_011500 [Prunus speciosa]
MEESKGVVKHVLLAKFKEGTSENQIEELTKGYAKLVDLIEPMKSFHWGKDVSIENLHQGFTHIFESTFESMEGVAEYVAHPAHVDFANLFLSHVEKVIVFDYKPTTSVDGSAGGCLKFSAHPLNSLKAPDAASYTTIVTKPYTLPGLLEISNGIIVIAGTRCVPCPQLRIVRRFLPLD